MKDNKTGLENNLEFDTKRFLKTIIPGYGIYSLAKNLIKDKISEEQFYTELIGQIP